MNIKNLNNLLKLFGLQEFSLDFEEKLNNKNIDTDFIEILKQVNKNGCNPLIYVLRFNNYKELNFKSKDILNLINLYPKQLLQVDNNGYNPLIYILANNKEEKLNIPMEYINKLYGQQINQPYSYMDYYNNKIDILFNEEYIEDKIKVLDDLTFFQEFLDYNKTLLEKQNIVDKLEINNTINTNYKMIKI